MLSSRKLSSRIYGLILLATVLLTSSVLFGQIKIMPLGDSITRGIGSSNMNGYRKPLKTMLDTETGTYGFSYDFVGSLSDGDFGDTEHEGHAGYSSDQLRAEIDTYLANAGNPDIVILHLGTNDIYDGRDIDSTVADIEAAIEKIGNSATFLLCSVIPRGDDATLDDNTTVLNERMKIMYYNKLNEGYDLYYVGLNEMFKNQSDWNSDTYYTSDRVHPNDTGYNLMAQTIFNVIMNAINATPQIYTDNFNRTNLGVTWVYGGTNFSIEGNELKNSSGANDWNMAIFAAIKDMYQVEIRWSDSADQTGIGQAGILLGVTAPNTSANGYLVWIRGGNLLTLYDIQGGAPVAAIDEKTSSLSFPQPGDTFKVVMRIEETKHAFDCYINNNFAGTLEDLGKLYADNVYSGLMSVGNLNNKIDYFNLPRKDDVIAPAAVTDLRYIDVGATHVKLSWTAPGDDGSEGTASGYDIRYSTNPINETNFSSASQATGEPTPSPAGSNETAIITNLSPGTTYYFALKTFDEAPNFSLLSNIEVTTTLESNALTDDFERASLGADWNADPEFQISNGELANVTGGSSWGYMAVFQPRANPIEVSFRYGVSDDAAGIGSVGLALMLDGKTPEASGYLAWVRPADGLISLFTIDNGEPASNMGSQTFDTQYAPGPGSVFKVAISSDGSSHTFKYYVDGVEIGQFVDNAPGDRGMASMVYAGVMMHGAMNNNIDDFSVLNIGGQPTNLNVLAGDNQAAPVNTALPESLVVSITDNNSIPIENVLVKFRVIAGGGKVDMAPPDANIRAEAEHATLSGTMVKEADETASGGYIVKSNGGDPMAGKAVFSVYVEQAGDYVVWGRLKTTAAGYSYYSYFVQVDGEPASISPENGAGTWDFFPNTDSWIWDRVSERGNGTYSSPQTDPKVYSLTAGLHTITITQRYPNTVLLDKILLTLSTSGYVPNGKEEYPEYITNAQGIVRAQWTVGTTVGTDNNKLEVFAPGYTLTNAPYTFTATALPAPPTVMEAASETTMSGTGGQPLSQQFKVVLKDNYGNPVPGYKVTFTVTTGNGFLDNGTNTQEVTSGVDGTAGVTLTLATDGATNEVVASYGNLPDITFQATASSGLATRLIKTNATLSGTVNTQLADNISVRVVDSNGNAVQNHDVTFKVLAGGGTLHPVTASNSPDGTTVVVRSNANGFAMVKYTLGKIAGENRIRASSVKRGDVPLTDSPVEFIATGVAGEAMDFIYVSGNNQTGAAGMPLAHPFVVKIVDAYNNGVPNYPVAFNVIQGTGALTPPGPYYTGADGTASVKLILGEEANLVNKVEATAEKNGSPLGSPIVFSATAGQVSAVERISSNYLTGSAKWPLDDSLKVKVLDNYGNPVGGYPVIWECYGDNLGSVNGETMKTVLTNTDGISRVEFVCGATPGKPSYVQAITEGLQGSPIVFKVSVADLEALQAISGDGQTGTVGSSLPNPFKVKVVDQFGRGISDYSVRFEIKEGGGHFNGKTAINVKTNENNEAVATLTLGPRPGTDNNVVEISAMRKGTQLLTNGGLDEWNGINLIGWGQYAAANTSVSRNISGARAGSCVKITGTTTNSYGHLYRPDNIPAKGSTKYRLSFWMKGTPGMIVYALIADNENYWLKPDGTWLSSKARWVDDYPAAEEYQLITIEFTSRAGISNFNGGEFRIYARGQGSVYFEDISLLEVNDTDVHLENSPLTFTASATIGPADSLVAVSGDSQQVVIGNQLENPIVVQITDKCGNPIPNYDVLFERTSGGGYIDANLINAIKKTNENGYVQVAWTVGTVAGELNNSLKVTANRSGGGQLRNSPYIFFASARSSSAYKIEKISGDNPKNSSVREQLPAPFVVKVVDKAGNGVENHPVTFSVQTGDGTFNTIDGDSVVTKMSGADGLVSVDYFPGPQAGVQNVVHAQSFNGAPELVNSPLVFTVTPIAGGVSPTASIIEATSPVPADGQTKSQITVTLTDDYGNPIPNKAVILKVSSSSNSIDQPLTKSDENGQVFGAVASTRAELKTISAYVIDDQLNLEVTGLVRFRNLEAKNIRYYDGGQQDGNFGAVVNKMIRARVTDKNGNPVYQHEVFFQVYQGGGSIYNANKQPIQEGDPVYTDSSGIAGVYWVLGNEEVNQAIANSPGLNGSAKFIAVGHQNPAARLSIVGGNNQTGTAGYTLPEPIVVKVTDANGWAVTGQKVTYTVTFGGGHFNGKSELSLTTDQFGEAKVLFTLGREAGSNTFEATSPGLADSPQYFFATGNSGAASRLVKLSGDGRRGTVGYSIGGIAVKVTDLYGNDYTDGYDVQFSVLSGDATIKGDETVTTGPDGVASTSLRLGTTTGEIVVQAYAPGLVVNNPVKFKIYSRPASPVDMKISGGNNQEGTVGRELVYPFQVLVVDQYDNPVPDVSIAFVRSGGNGTLLTSTEVNTDEDGIAAARYQLGSQTGNYQVTAIHNGLNGSPLYFNATGVTNNFPEFTHIAPVTSKETQIISFVVNANDLDNDPITYEATNLPNGAGFDASHRFNWTPSYVQAGEYEVHFIARDGKGGIDEEIVPITVTNANRKPEIINIIPEDDYLIGHRNLGETINFGVTVKDKDPDDEITYEWKLDGSLVVSTLPNYSLYVNDPLITLGRHTISVTVSDGTDTIERTWELDVKTPVELATFSYEIVPRAGVYLKWKTGYENNNAGFNVLRSRTINGDFEPINDALIPSRDDGMYKFLDIHVRSGEMYYYKIEDVSLDGRTSQHSIIKVLVTKPDDFELSQNYPNPFNPTTKINFQLPEQQVVSLKVYNMMGQEVATLVDGPKEAGYHTAVWNGFDKYGNQVASGIYYYRIIAGTFVRTKKMLLLK